MRVHSRCNASEQQQSTLSIWLLLRMGTVGISIKSSAPISQTNIMSRLLKSITSLATTSKARGNLQTMGLQPCTGGESFFLLCQQQQIRKLAAANPPSSYDPPHPPILFDLVLRADWKSAIKRITSHPIEARYRHPRGYTLLHCSVEYQAPTELIEMMAKAYPEALMMKDWQGRSIVDVAVNNETKAFLEKISKSTLHNMQDDDDDDEDDTGKGISEETGGPNNLSLSQMKSISKQLLEIETCCHKLRAQLDSLTDELEGKK